jgi:hypothetical protein
LARRLPDCYQAPRFPIPERTAEVLLAVEAPNPHPILKACLTDDQSTQADRQLQFREKLIGLLDSVASSPSTNAALAAQDLSDLARMLSLVTAPQEEPDLVAFGNLPQPFVQKARKAVIDFSDGVQHLFVDAAAPSYPPELKIYFSLVLYTLEPSLRVRITIGFKAPPFPSDRIRCRQRLWIGGL